MEKLTRKITEEVDEHTAFEALEASQQQGKTICNLAEADKHVMENGGALWCLPIIA